MKKSFLKFFKELYFEKMFIGTLFGILITTMTYQHYGDILFNILGYSIGYGFVGYGIENLKELYKK